MRELHSYENRKRSLGLKQRVRLSSLEGRVTSDVISCDSCSKPRGFDSEILWYRWARRYLTRNIISSFYAETASAFLLRPLVPGFFWPRPQISRFGKELLYRSPAFRKRKLEEEAAAAVHCTDVVCSPQKSNGQIMLDVTSCSLLPAAATAISPGRTARLFVYCAARNSIKPRELGGREAECKI